MNTLDTLGYWKDLFSIINTLEQNPDLHNQATFHTCNTAHCIAGWLEERELERRGISHSWTSQDSNALYEADYIKSNGITRRYSPVIEEYRLENNMNGSTWEWAAEALGLTCEKFGDRSHDLFAPLLDLEEVKENAIDLAYEIGYMDEISQMGVKIRQTGSTMRCQTGSCGA